MFLYVSKQSFFFLSVGKFSVQNIVPSPDGDSSKVKVKVRMDIHGIFSVCSAQLVEKLLEPEQEAPEPMETAPEGEKKTEQQQVDGEATEPTMVWKPLLTNLVKLMEVES